MKLNDDFQKLELQVDSTCKRIEKQYSDLATEMNEKVELKLKLIMGPGNQYKDVEVPVYLQNFSWDTVQYQFDKTLEWMGLKVQKETKSAEDKVKQQVEKMQAIK